MNKIAIKRKSVDVPCPAPEDASSFYKRLGLDILAPSSTSGQSEAGPPKKRTVQQASHTAPLNTTPTQRPDKVGQQWTTPTQRPDKVGQQWYQSQQRERQAPHHFKQNYPHENKHNGRTASVNVAATYQPQHVPVHRPHEQQTHYRTGVVNSGNTYQPQHVQPTHPIGYQSQTRTSFGNGNIPQQHRVHPTHPHTRTESMSTVASHKPQHAQQPQQRVVRKEPQVKPINRYAPPDYMTIMYHPTPTLEDLGLTSYLDSPPSSPRARSPAREAEMADSPPAQESPRRVLPAWDAPRSVSPAQESSSDSSEREFKTAISQAIEIETAISADKQSPKTVSETKKSTLNVTNQMSERHQTISNTQMSQHLTTKVEPKRYVPSFAPNGWDPHAKSSKSLQGPASTVSVINATSRPATFTVPISKSANGPDVQSTNSTGPGSGSTLAEKPEKWACNWSLIAEQYSTESRHSVNEKQRCDALYRRYNTDERQQTHTTKHHQNHDAWHQEHTNVQHSKQTFDQILAEQIARQAELKSNNHNLALQTCTNVREKRSKCQSITKTSLPIVNMDDLFGGMSPYSCWNQSAPEDPRFS